MHRKPEPLLQQKSEAAVTEELDVNEHTQAEEENAAYCGCAM